MPSRFVILHHRMHGGEHWDLMLERGDVLATWQLACEPIDRSVLPIAARRIGDHRTAYLEYEGPVSGDRGDVRRVDSGTVEITSFGLHEVVFRLQGQRLNGALRLVCTDDAWTLRDWNS